jgi:hypothetical protein
MTGENNIPELKRDGLRDPIQSGLCRTDRPYIPRLRPAREALPPAPFQDEVNMPGKDAESLSGGSRGQSPLAAREERAELRSEAEQHTSLDEIEINRHTQTLDFQKLGRNRFCGKWTIFGDKDGKRSFIRLNCRQWDCIYCGPRKAKRYKRAIRALAEQQHLTRFLTLTLDPSKIDSEAVRFLRKVFNKFREYLRRKYRGPIKYIAVLEFQKSGVPHLHVLLDRFIPWAWIRESWSALGGGDIVDIRYVDVHRVSRYLSKYLTKDLLLSAPKRSRRVTLCRAFHLFEKSPKEMEYHLLRVSVFALFWLHESRIVEMQFDEEQVLKMFATSALSGNSTGSQR